MAYDIVPVNPAMAQELWPQVKGFIEQALKRTHIDALYLPEDILVDLTHNRRHLWIVHDGPRIDAAIVAHHVIYPRAKTYCAFIVAGKNMHAWLDLANQKLEAFAKKEGCRGMEGGGRKGWVRAAGYEVKGLCLYKELV